MKISFSTRQLFALGFALLLLTNIVTLAGVVYNRSGEPEARITLTERELSPPYYTHEENSGFALQLVWRNPSNQTNDQYLYYSRPVLYSGYGNSPDWLDRDKLEMLGFDTAEVLRNGDERERRKLTVPREAYMVLEYDGAAYQQALARAQAAIVKDRASLAAKPEDETLQKRLEKAEQWLAFERTENSRLFAVDVGLDPSLLRQQYSDRSRFIIAKGLVSAEYRGNCKKPGVFGRIKRININSIHVPLQFRKQFNEILVPRTLRSDSPPNPPRYAVDLEYGRHLEPWIVAVRSLDNPNPEKSGRGKQHPESPE